MSEKLNIYHKNIFQGHAIIGHREEFCRQWLLSSICSFQSLWVRVHLEISWHSRGFSQLIDGVPHSFGIFEGKGQMGFCVFLNMVTGIDRLSQKIKNWINHKLFIKFISTNCLDLSNLFRNFDQNISITKWAKNEKYIFWNLMCIWHPYVISKGPDSIVGILWSKTQKCFWEFTFWYLLIKYSTKIWYSNIRRYLRHLSETRRFRSMVRTCPIECLLSLSLQIYSIAISIKSLWLKKPMKELDLPI